MGDEAPGKHVTLMHKIPDVVFLAHNDGCSSDIFPKNAGCMISFTSWFAS